MNAEELHKQGAKLREEAKHRSAVAMLSEAILLGVIEEDYETVAGALGDRSLVWKHMFLATQKETFIDLCQKDVELMMETAKTKAINHLAAKSLFCMGEVMMLKQDYNQATEWFEQAVAAKEDSAEKGDFIYHLGEAMYREGKAEEGRLKIEAGIEMIKRYEAETDSFLNHVWLSGAYLRLAELIKERGYLDKAREIIEADDRLVIRKRQLEKMLEKV